MKRDEIEMKIRLMQRRLSVVSHPLDIAATNRVLEKLIMADADDEPTDKERATLAAIDRGENIIECRKQCSTLRANMSHIREKYDVIATTKSGEYCIIRKRT